MTPRIPTSRELRGLAIFALWAIVLVLAAGARAPAEPQTVAQAATAAAAPAAQQPAAYAGEETCATCHQAEAQGYRDSAHALAWDPRTPAAAQACESCHGPGATHVADPGAAGSITNFLKIAPRDVSERCTTCHNREEHAQWQGSMHDSRNVTCVNCHSVHTPKSEGGLLKEVAVVQTCAQCHQDKAAKLLRSNHMPVREGKLTCATCHNQHGSTNVRMLRVGNTVNETCTSCHTEKRGPFLWEHAPVRENCTTCHDPHGTSNDRMLVAKAPMLCQRCHAFTRHPSTIYDAAAVTSGNNRIVGRACVNCHSNIHGSNHPSGLYFQR